MTADKNVVEDQRVRKYLDLAEARLEQAQNEGIPQEVIAKAARYLSDGKHYFDRGDNATALASISYSHGLLDGSTPAAENASMSPDQVRQVLAGIFLNRLASRPPLTGLAGIPLEGGCLRALVANLEKEGLLDRSGGEMELTPPGRSRIKVGLVAGVFDLIHPGHLAFLNWARGHVDLLSAIVARDPNSESRKGRKPVQSERDRLSLVRELKPVDYAMLGSHDDMYSPVLQIRPDFILLGKDQDIDGRRVKAELAKRGLKVQVTRSRVWDSGELSKTTRILDRIARDVKR